jgi:hypothetical protein
MLLSISGMICRFTLNANDNPLASKILITTYNIITHHNSCSSMEFRRIMWLQQQEWGIMVDEVHAISTDMLDSVLTVSCSGSLQSRFDNTLVLKVGI